MGRDNPYEADGLRPGVPLLLEVSMAELVSHHVTMLEGVDEDSLSVLTPMTRLEYAPLPPHAVVHAGYSHEGKRMRFVSEVIGISPDRSLQYLLLPPEIERSERRRYYRLPTAFPPIDLFQLVRIPGSEAPRDLAKVSMVVDLSEGGLCLSTRAQIAQHDRLAIHFEMPGYGPVISRMTVVGVELPEKGFLNERAHCSFDDIDRATQDRIARFVMHRQLELRGTVKP